MRPASVSPSLPYSGCVSSADALAGVLQEFFKANGPPFMYPRRIDFVDALPKSLTGKVQRSVSRKQAWEAPAAPSWRYRSPSFSAMAGGTRAFYRGDTRPPWTNLIHREPDWRP